DTLTYYRYYHFNDSSFKNYERKWSGFQGINKNSNSQKYTRVEGLDNEKLAVFCRKLIPSILYFPNFLFDFPSKIYLETKDEASPKEKFYIDLIQDILNSLDNETNLQTHLVNRIK